MKLPIPSMHGLTTERLVFRTPSLADVDRWMPYHNDAGSIRFMPFTLGRREDCSYFIQRSLDRFERDGSGLYAIERHDGSLVGMIGLLTQTVDDLPELEIGYHLLPTATGHGYATEAAIACRAFAQEHRLHHSVISLIDHGNTASQAVARRNGLVYEKDTVHHGEPAMVWRGRL